MAREVDFDDLDVSWRDWTALKAGLRQSLLLAASLVIAGSYEEARTCAAPGFESVFLHDISHQRLRPSLRLKLTRDTT